MRLVAIACFVIACGRSAKPLSDQELEVRAVSDAIAKLSSADVDERSSGALGLAVACCDFEADQWRPSRAVARRQACAALQPVLLDEQDPRVLEAPMSRFTSGHCDVTLPWQLLLKRCEELPPRPIGDDACEALQIVEPTPEAASAIVAVARKHVADPRMRRHLVIALGEMGEQELVSVVPLMSDTDARIRDLGVETFFRALSRAPLDLPDSLRGLDILSNGPDKALASFAGVIAEDYRKKASEPTDVTVERLLGRPQTEDIRALGLRRFSCKATNARSHLERLVGGHDGGAVVARRALAMRAKRCGK